MCPAHSLQKERTRYNRDVRKWYYTERWKQLRRLVIQAQHHACAECGHVELVLDVDHIEPHRGDPAKFWNVKNLQGLCASCHSRKTGKGQ